MILPESLTGLDLAKRLKKEKGTLKVIITSGYHGNQTGSPPMDPQEITCLAKPYQSAALAKIVRRCLEKTRDAAGHDGAF
jgi:DNA-binding NtrC family response regulator